MSGEEKIVMARTSEFTAVLESGDKPTIKVREGTGLSGATECDFNGFEDCYFSITDARILHVMLGKAIAEAEKWAAEK